MRYNLDWGSQELIILFESILFNPFTYFFIMFRSNIATTLLVMIITSLLHNQWKYWILHLFFRVVCTYKYNSMLSRWTFSSYVKFRFILWSYIVSDVMYLIILLEDSLGKAFLILMISLILPLKACVYNLLFDFGAKFDNWFL